MIILPAVDDEKCQQLRKSIQESIGDQRVQVNLVRLSRNSAEQILKVIKQFQGRILLLESSTLWLTDDQKQELITQADFPVILMHG